MTNLSLRFGANALIPADVSAVWGARLIVNQDGMVDLVHDRQAFAGDESVGDVLCAKLNRSSWRSDLADMLRSRRVLTSQGEDVTVYEDDSIIVRGNTNGSYGYFYVAAWLKS